MNRWTYIKFIFIFCSIKFSVLSAQDAYFITDTSKTVGVEIELSSEFESAHFFLAKVRGTWFKYTPYEVREFGMADGRVYISMQVVVSDTLRNVFLERLVDGRIKLYYYPGKLCNTYLLERQADSLLKGIPSRCEGGNLRMLRDALAEYSYDCNKVSEAIRDVNYKRAVISKYIDHNNQCKSLSLPYRRFRFSANINYSRLNLLTEEANGNIADFRVDRNLIISSEIELPIRTGKLSYSSGLRYHKFSMQLNYIDENYSSNPEFIVYINESSVEIPLILRYTFLNGNWRPYINIGISRFYFFVNEYEKYRISEINRNLKTSWSSTDLSSRSGGGLSVGSGMYYQLKSRRALFIEMRLNLRNVWAVHQILEMNFGVSL